MNPREKESFSGQEDIIVLHGNDELAMKDSINGILAQSGGFSGLNNSILSAKEASPSDISMQLSMLPLGAGKRIVVVEHAQEVLNSKQGPEWFYAILANFSPSSQLVLFLDDEQEYKNREYVWKRYPDKSWLRKALNAFSGVFYWQELLLPNQRDMPAWISKIANSLGGDFHPQAAKVLANLVGSDLFQAQHEIEKAITYAGEGQQVSVADIRLICTAAKEEGVFDLVDAVGVRDGKEAMRIYKYLRIDMAEQYIFSLLAKQIRLLLQACYVQESRSSTQELMRVCDTHSSWFANKLLKQASHFNSTELEEMYSDLDKIDENSKKGIISLDVAIETFLAKVTQL